MHIFKNALIGAALSLYLAAPAYAIGPFPNQPLYLSSSVAPNVMLLVDNSGSMENIIQPAGVAVSYYAAVAYSRYCTNWDCSTIAALSDINDANIRLNTINQDYCADEYKAIWDSLLTVKRCYKFPDPVGSGNTRYTAKYLAYIYNTFTAADNDLTAKSDTAVPKTYRMQVARDSAKGIVLANRAMRMGLTTFNAPTNQDSGPGGSVVREVKSLSAVNSAYPTANVTQVQADENYSNLVTGIDGLIASTSTPLAESYYEITRYFRGLSRHQDLGSGTHTSPIQYRCQKNFGIVLTDGLPTNDRSFPTGDPDRDNPAVDGDNNLAIAGGHWDGLAPTFGLPYSDGSAPGDVNSNGEGATLLLDDIAKFAFDIDLKTSGNDLAGRSFNDTSNAAFTKQNLRTFTVGFSVDNQMLEDAAEYGGGSYYTASDSTSLNSALNSALQSIRSQISSASAITANSTRIQAGTLIFQARYNSSDWTGELRAFNVDDDGAVGTQAWSTTDANKIPAAGSRNIFTFNGSAGSSFLWDSLTVEQKTSLRKGAETDDANARLRLGWLRGANDGAVLGAPFAGARLRTRNAVLGDIINSDPKFVGQQNNGYNVPNTVATDEPADSYYDYVTAKAALTPLVVVGANDGMVHAFNGSTGAEAFAYVPASLFKTRTANPGSTPGLLALAESDYGHQFYADGSFGLGDVYDGTNWKTYLAGGLGSGGRGVFALNMTSRASFAAAGVLWERTAPDTAPATPATDGSDWNDLGYIFGEPTIGRVKLSNSDPGTWVAIFGNGYASNSGKAALYIVNATTGALLRRIKVDDPDNASLNNGLSTVTPYLNADRYITHVYGGDLQGNVWKFDLTVPDNQTVKHLFQAKKGTVRQPITSKVRVISHPSEGRMVVFGTGKYLETPDKADTAVQSIYGIWDRGRNSDATVPANKLVQQTINTEVASDGREFRIVSQNAVDWTTKFGWYMDLQLVGAPAAGERVVSMPVVNKSRVLFSTFTPLSDPCLSGGESWILGLNVLTGGRLDTGVFDVNGDRVFNAADMLSGADTSGFKLGDGSLDSPGTLFGDGFDSLYNSGLGQGGIEQNTAAGSGGKPGRMSWRQVQ